MAELQPIPGFFHALLGLVVAPRSTTVRLFAVPSPPFSITFLILLLISVFEPVLVQQYKYGMSVYDLSAVLSIFLTFLFSFLIFMILELLLLRLFSVPCSFEQALALISYSLVPLILVIWVIYFFNYLTSGSITLAQYLVTGHVEGFDSFFDILPVVFSIAEFIVLVVFFFSIRALGQMFPITALGITAFSLVPLILAIILGMVLADWAHPGSMAAFMRIIDTPQSLTEFHTG